MPRRARSIHVGVCYHVLNRGNNRGSVFHCDADYREFLALVAQAQTRHALDVFGLCLMPNHFHMVVRPNHGGALGRSVHWLLTTHAHRYHLRHDTCGRVWQGRYKAFPIQQDSHFLVVLRYVERNALRAGLVERARDWPWGSASWRDDDGASSVRLAPPPVHLPASWSRRLDEPQTAAEVEAVRARVNQPHPFGDEAWVADALECQAYRRSGRPPGRPRKQNPENR